MSFQTAAREAADPTSSPGNSSLQSRLVEASCLALLVTTPLLMNVSGLRTFEAMKFAAAIPLACIALVSLIAMQWTSGLPWSRPVIRHAVFRAYMAWLACVFLATLLSETPWIAFYGEYFRREGLIAWAICGLMFLGILATLKQPNQWERAFDAILIVSVVPCSYAVMQRFGLDFFATTGLGDGTGARPGANLGNPTFLAAYLLFVIPLTLARAAQPGHSTFWRIAYATLASFQFFAAILTQSRGPLLGLVTALLLCAVGTAARLRIRWALWFVFSIFLLALGVLAAINFNVSAQSLIVETPLQRFVIAGGNDLTSTSRVAIWQAGVDAFSQAPLWRQMLGYGPDTSYISYFAHLNSTALRIEGYSETIDRLHSETLETLMTMGVLGWIAQGFFFSALVWTTSSRLANWVGYRPLLAFSGLCVCVSALVGIVFLMVAKSTALFPIGLGLGLGAIWTVTLLESIRRMCQRDTSASTVGDDITLIALTACLIGSWIESQVGVPTITTRLMIATYGASILLVSMRGTQTPPPPLAIKPSGAIPATTRKGKKSRPSKSGPVDAPRIPSDSMTYAGWLTGLALIVSTAAYFPPLTGNLIYPPSVHNLHLIAIPLASLLVAGGWAASQEGKRICLPAMEALSGFLMWSIIPWFLFVLVYVDLGRAIAGASDSQVGERINHLLMSIFASGALAVLLRALIGPNGIFGGSVPGQSRTFSVALLLIVFGATASSLWAAMLDVRADTFLKLSGWAQRYGREEAQPGFLQKAASIAPFERRYGSAYASHLVEKSLKDISRARDPDAVIPDVLKQLSIAGTFTQDSILKAPRDPWMNYGHANVHRLFTLDSLSRAISKEEREQHISNARMHYALAHQEFPAHPWMLRNWAQMEYELGDKQAAYAKFDQMERLDPLNISAYTDRVRIATAAGDHQAALATLNRGISLQPPGSSARNQLKVELASYHRKLGNLQQALVLWLEVLQSNPENVDVAGNLMDAYMQLGQSENALSIARRTLTQLQAEPQTRQKRALRAKIEALISRIPASAGNR